MIKKIGIIGIGSIGLRHLRLLRELRPDLDITVIRSSNNNKNQKLEWANLVVHSLDDAIDTGIEAAIIATPATYHVKQAIYLMEKGIHVLIEKPLSASLDKVEDLLKLNEQNKVVGLVGYCLRYNPGALKFVNLLNNQKIGRVLHVRVDCGSYLPNWRKKKDYQNSVSSIKSLGGGVLLELSHELDYVRWFFGEMESVYASINNSGVLNINVEDSTDIIFESKKGYPISVHLDFNSRTNRRKCTATCTNGDLIWDAVTNEVIWVTGNGVEDSEKFDINPDYIYREQLKHFIHCIEKKVKPTISIEDGALVIKMINSIKLSYQTGQKVFLA